MKNSLLVIALMLITVVRSQILPNSVPPSPDATALHLYGNTQNNHYTGSPNVTIPIWEIREGDLKLPIYLKYTGGNGIKVEEIASWVGLGWTLNAGGAVSRIIRGIADEDQDRMGFWNMTEIPVLEYDNYMIFDQIGSGLVDGEPDKFMYDFPGGSGSFFCNYDGNIHFKPKKNINATFNIGTEPESISIANCSTNHDVVTEFKITDEYGRTFQFRDKVRSNSFTHGTPIQDIRGFPSTWYLSKMENSHKTDSIDFEYDTYAYTLKRRQTSIPVSSSMEVDGYMETSYIGKRLKKISFTNGFIEFIASTEERKDLNSNKYLEKIIVRDRALKVIKVIKFNYNYLTANGQVPVNTVLVNDGSNRLILTSIEECDADNNCLPPYVFTYNTSKYLPGRFSKAIDHWGYYNGQDSNVNLEPKHIVTWYNPAISEWVTEMAGYSNREPDGVFAIAGILEKIQYPTGGSTIFEFEPHTALHDELNRKSISNKEILMWQGQRHPFDVELFSASNPITNLTTEGSYDNPECSLRIYIENMATNVIHVLSLDGVSYPQDVDLGPGSYEAWFELTTDYVGPCTQIDPIMINLKWTDEDSSPNAVVGGLRVKSASDYSGNGLLSTKRIFDYNNASGITTGRINNAPQYYGLVYFRPLEGGSWNPMGFQRFVNSNAPLSLTQGSEVGYGKVSVTDLIGENGKTEYHYSTAEDYPDVYNAVNPINSSPNFEVHNGFKIYPFPKSEISSMDFLRGQLKKETVYKKVDGQFSKVYMKEVFYDSLKYAIGDFQSIDDHIKNSAKAVRGLKVYNPLGPGYGSEFVYYDIYSGYNLTSKIIENRYDGPNAYVEHREYKYDSDSYGLHEHYIPITEEVRASDGAVLRTQTDFVFNKGSLTCAELDLWDKNALYLPLQTDEYRGNLKLNTKYTRYNNVKWLGQNQPEAILAAKGSNLLENRIIYHDYFPDGNTKEVSKADGTHIIHVWGYNGQYLIAKIENSTYMSGWPNAVSPVQQALIDNAVSASNLDVDFVSENSLRDELELLRIGFSKSLVTTYTYDLLVGVTSITDPKGYTVHYDYDGFNRLRETRDDQGKLLSEYRYHYKNQ